jgi:hypothetical protein
MEVYGLGIEQGLPTTLKQCVSDSPERGSSCSSQDVWQLSWAETVFICESPVEVRALNACGVSVIQEIL